MKNPIILSLTLGLGVMLASCSPQVFNLRMDMRYPSASGLDMIGKSLAVVYVESGDGSDSVFVSSMANGMASALEEGYFNGEQEVGLFKLTDSGAAGLSPDYGSKDTLVNLVIDTGYDVVMLIDKPEFMQLQPNSVSRSKSVAWDSIWVVNTVVPLKIKMYAYDSMAKMDSVLSFASTTSFTSKIYRAEKSLEPESSWNDIVKRDSWESALKLGKSSANKFRPRWVGEDFTFIYYSSAAWIKAAEATNDGKWKEAIDGWMKLTSTSNPEKRSVAEFNLAQIFYILGDYELAGLWLDRSDKDTPISIASTLRSRINNRKK